MRQHAKFGEGCVLPGQKNRNPRGEDDEQGRRNSSYDDFRILSLIRQRVELIFAAPLPAVRHSG